MDKAQVHTYLAFALLAHMLMLMVLVRVLVVGVVGVWVRWRKRTVS